MIGAFVAAFGANSRNATIHMIGNMITKPDTYMVRRPMRPCKNQDPHVPKKAIPYVPKVMLNESLEGRPAKVKKYVV